MATDGTQLLGPVLRDVSRSFYKTLQLLPRSVRTPISLAYLLARTTDTIADTELVPAPQRLESLQKIRQRIAGEGKERLSFAGLLQQQNSPAEALLLERVEESLGLLGGLPDQDQRLIRKVLDTIVSGQTLDLKRFAGSGPEHVVALQSDDELDDYTYRVAGCVGEFWTRICRVHVFPGDHLDDEWLVEKGVRFGKGLQLINILRDVAADLRKGRCYLPADSLSKIGLQPRDLLDPKMEPRVRPLYNQWLERAEGHLAAGWEYTLALPWRAFRLRLACALPLQIGAGTLSLLKVASVLDPTRRVKISRQDVKRAFYRAVLYYPFPSLWKRLGPASKQDRLNNPIIL